MNNPSSRRTSSRISTRKTCIATCVALACISFTSLAPAQVVVSDPLGLVKQAASLEQEIQSAANTYETLQNVLTKAESLGNNISLVNTPLKKITNSGPIIDSACPGAGGGGIAGEALNAIASALSPNQSVASRQQVICSTIVVYQIDEYNKTVDALNAVGQFSATTLSKLHDLANVADTLGKNSTAQAQAADISVALSTAMHTWQTQIQSDEEMVSALQKQQSILAKVAMNGNPTILGTVIQASALKVAFTVNQ